MHTHAFLRQQEYLAFCLLSATVNCTLVADDNAASTTKDDDAVDDDTTVDTTIGDKIACKMDTTAAKMTMTETQTKQQGQQQVSKQASHVTVIFTCSAPEQLDDACAGNVQVSHFGFAQFHNF